MVWEVMMLIWCHSRQTSTEHKEEKNKEQNMTGRLIQSNHGEKKTQKYSTHNQFNTETMMMTF